jgi:hypothetical protein
MRISSLQNLIPLEHSQQFPNAIELGATRMLLNLSALMRGMVKSFYNY